METFLEFLQSKHADGYMGTDDNMPDDFERWLSGVDLEILIDWADQYAEEKVKKVLTT